jgi:hypothetical protein
MLNSNICTSISRHGYNTNVKLFLLLFFGYFIAFQQTEAVWLTINWISHVKHTRSNFQKKGIHVQASRSPKTRGCCFTNTAAPRFLRKKTMCYTADGPGSWQQRPYVDLWFMFSAGEFWDGWTTCSVQWCDSSFLTPISTGPQRARPRAHVAARGIWGSYHT